MQGITSFSIMFRFSLISLLKLVVSWLPGAAAGDVAVFKLIILQTSFYGWVLLIAMRLSNVSLVGC